MNTYHRMDCQELSTILRFGGGTFEKGMLRLDLLVSSKAFPVFMLRLDLLVSSKAFPASLIISRFLLAFHTFSVGSDEADSAQAKQIQKNNC